MIPIVTPAEMAAVDAAALDPVAVLIERAGGAVAHEALRLLGGGYGRRVVVIAGKGNNGNDGRAAARVLRRRGVRVTVIAADSGDSMLPPADLIIDAAYGTGFRGTWVAPRPSDPTTPVLAVDIPSGISGATGLAIGEPLHATRTVTFAALKPGLLIGDGPDYAGVVTVADIGLDVDRPHPPRAWLVEADDVMAWRPARSSTTHKWKAAVRLVAGSPGMTGSAELAARAALRAGAGYVRRSSPGIDPKASGGIASPPIEAVMTALPTTGWAELVLADLDRFTALAVGPGLGTSDTTLAEVRRLLAAPVPLVVDGDGLRALGASPDRLRAARPAGLPPAVLTPHDAEFVRLGGVLDPEGDRFEAVRDLARCSGAVVLLKGPATLVAHPDGRVLVCDEGDDRLATAGTGDVLTGVVAALLAQGTAPFEAAASAAFLHGRAARRGRRRGFVAGDLPDLFDPDGSDAPRRMGEDGRPADPRSTHG